MKLETLSKLQAEMKRQEPSLSTVNNIVATRILEDAIELYKAVINGQPKLTRSKAMQISARAVLLHDRIEPASQAVAKEARP